MIKNKVVDIVMFVYNEEKHISEQLDSLIVQKEFINKIIIIDDFSTDDTYLKVEDYKSEIEIEFKKNKIKGKINALAYGLTLVESDYFLVCAGDDKFLENSVSQSLGYLKDTNLPFCYLNYKIVDENLENPYFINKKTKYTIKEMLNKNYASGYIFGKKEIINAILPIEKDIPFEDWYIALKLAVVYDGVYILNKPMFLYRKHIGSTTYNKTKKKYLFLLERDYKLFKILYKNDMFIKYSFLVNNKIKWFKYMLYGYSLKDIKDIFFLKNISYKDKIKVIIFKPFLKWRFDR